MGIMTGATDDLIRRIRARAWNPGAWLGRVSLPSHTVAASTDPQLATLRASIHSTTRPYPVTVPGGCAAALEYYRDAPRAPQRQPLPVAIVRQAEQRMGVVLPDLLVRVYTEVGDGGFGPGLGILGIGEDGWGAGDGGTMTQMWTRMLSDPPRAYALGIPLCDYGCAIWDFLSPGPPHHVREQPGSGEADAAGLPLSAWLEKWLAS